MPTSRVGVRFDGWCPSCKFSCDSVSSVSAATFTVLLISVPDVIQEVGYFCSFLHIPWPPLPPLDLRILVVIVDSPSELASVSFTGMGA